MIRWLCRTLVFVNYDCVDGGGTRNERTFFFLVSLAGVARGRSTFNKIQRGFPARMARATPTLGVV